MPASYTVNFIDYTADVISTPDDFSIDYNLYIPTKLPTSISPDLLDAIAGTLTRRAPVSTKQIETKYEVFYGEQASFTFNFGDPLAM